MKIAITAKGTTLDAGIDPRFGRAPYFIFVEMDSMDYEAVANPNVDMASGAGIQTARLVVEKGAEAVLSGSCGPNAFEVLEAAGIKVYIGVTGEIPKALEALKTGKLMPTDGPDVEGHKHENDKQQTPNSTASSPAPGMKGSGRGKGGVCVCPDCGTTVDHTAGVPCTSESCPKCGSRMIRE